MKRTGSNSRRIKRGTRKDFEVSWRGQIQLACAWAILAAFVAYLQPIVGSDIVDPRIVDVSILAAGYVLSAVVLLVFGNFPLGRKLKLHKHPEREENEMLPPMKGKILPLQLDKFCRRAGVDAQASARAATILACYFLSPRLLQSPALSRA